MELSVIGFKIKMQSWLITHDYVSIAFIIIRLRKLLGR